MTDEQQLWQTIAAAEQRQPIRAETISFPQPLAVSGSTIASRYPGGHWVPPPPPGYGPANAQGAYVASLPWGQIWFAFVHGDRLTQISISPGTHHAPGV